MNENNMSRIGIIPFNFRDDAIALLFVTSQTRGRWVLPKGKPEKGESHAQTCHREGFEEAGVRGVVLEDFPTAITVGRQTDNGVQQVDVTYYPYLVLEQADGWPEIDLRQRRWVLIEDAPNMVSHEDFMEVIEHFEANRHSIIEAAQRHINGLKRARLMAP